FSRSGWSSGRRTLIPRCNRQSGKQGAHSWDGKLSIRGDSRLGRVAADHHIVNAASESLDTMVVFDHKGKFVRSWGRQFKGGAHGLTIQKEGSDEFLY